MSCCPFIYFMRVGSSLNPHYQALNPQCLVPTLVVNDGKNVEVITQSIAILEYLEELYPDKPLLPKSPQARAFVRSLAQQIACDIHPLNNLKVLKYLSGEFDILEKQKKAWYQHWVEIGLRAFEAFLVTHHCSKTFCYQDQPTFADLCLIPQLYNARRFQCGIEDCFWIQKIEAHCLTYDFFQDASPDASPQ